jgi:hypothetical protein
MQPMCNFRHNDLRNREISMQSDEFAAMTLSGSNSLAKVPLPAG